MCQHEKPPANETTESLSLTVCKLELHGKGIVSQSRSGQDYALYLDEIPCFSSVLVLALFCFLLECFMMMKGFGFESVTTIECRQKVWIMTPRQF